MDLTNFVQYVIHRQVLDTSNVVRNEQLNLIISHARVHSQQSMYYL